MDQLLSSLQMEDASSKFTARSAGSARIRNDLMQRAALLSLCSKYRYRLGRCRPGSPTGCYRHELVKAQAGDAK